MDGVMQAPGGPNEDRDGGFQHGGWLVPYFDAKFGEIMTEWTKRAGAFLLGRKTYEIFAGSWPKATDPADEIATALNTRPKFVATRTLDNANWNNSILLKGDIAEEVAKLNAQEGREVQVHGSSNLIQTLLKHDLVDTLRIWQFPVVLGIGKRLFGEGTIPRQFPSCRNPAEHDWCSSARLRARGWSQVRRGRGWPGDRHLRSRCSTRVMHHQCPGGPTVRIWLRAVLAIVAGFVVWFAAATVGNSLIRIGFHPGYFRANSTSLDLTVYGRGGHGAFPQSAIDPVVIAARIVLGLQTIVSRENNPLDPAVITVGSIHGGSASNIIPDQVKLRVTVRSLDPAVHKRLLAAIERQAKGEALAANAPKEPLIETKSNTDAVYNDPELTQRMVAAARAALGADQVVEMPAQMGGEDFSQFGLAGVRAVLLHVGAVDATKLETSRKSGVPVPGVHSPLWAPEREPTIKAAISAETAILRDLLDGK